MNFFEKALTLESDGEKALRELADKTTSLALKKIFLLLADDEIGHKEIITKLQNNQLSEVDSKGINEASNIFLNIIGDERELETMSNNIDLYHELKKMEDSAEALYSTEASKVTDLKYKEILYKLAEEEQRHGALLDNLLEHIHSYQQTKTG